MKLTILGSGTYQPEKDRHCSAYLVETAKSKICFDFGRGAIDQLFKVGVHVSQIDAVFISHWHPDHFSDLISLIHITIAAPADLAVDWIPRKNRLKIYGPKGTTEKIQQLKEVSIMGHLETTEMEVSDIKPGDFIEGNGWQVRAFEAVHNPDSNPLSYRLEADSKVFAYSGDTIDCEGLRQAIKDADLAVIEAGWPDEVNSKTHLTGSKAGKIAQENGVKKLVLTHVAPYYIKNGDPIADAKKYFKSEIVLAKDLMAFEI